LDGNQARSVASDSAGYFLLLHIVHARPRPDEKDEGKALANKERSTRSKRCRCWCFVHLGVSKEIDLSDIDLVEGQEGAKMSLNTVRDAGWAGRPVHNQTFIEKYGKSQISFGLAGRIIITIIAVYIGIWFILTLIAGGLGSMMTLTGPAAAIYLAAILPMLLRGVWKRNERRQADRRY